jgi:PKD repeat protein
MRKIQHFFLFAFLFIFFNSILSAQNVAIHSSHTSSPVPNQEECGSDKIHQRLLNNNPIYRQNFEDIQRRVEQEIRTNPPASGRAPLLTIPVVFHVMHVGEVEGTGTNISYEQILSAVASLNDAYRGLAPYTSSGVDMEIEFCLASQDPFGNATNGVNRVDASGTSDYASNGLTTSGTDNETTIKALSRWSNTDYYNIWVVSEIDGNNGGGGTQGFAYFPGASAPVDGTVILHNAMGFDPTAARCFNVKNFTNYNITLIHEIGHALGLFHTFQGDANGTACPANGNCTTDGDRVCDTPPHERSSACLIGTNNLCGTLRDNHVHNFMEYSSDDCQTEFTADQKTRARAFLTGGRADLLTSVGCTPVAPPVSNFTTECAGTSVAGCTGTTIQFYDLSTHSPTSWTWTFSGGTPSSSTAQNPSVSYATAGTYSVTLVASNAFGLGSTETKSGFITIYDSPTAACTPGIQNTGFFGYSFSNVTFNNINNSTAPATNGPQDFSCTQTSCVTEGQNYTLSITVGNSGSQSGFYNCFIDYNDDGVFSAAESILSGSTVANSGYQTITQNVLIPTNAVEGDLLRMRVINDQFNLSGPCDNLFTGESEDYGIFISTAAAITTQPGPANACAGANTSFSVITTGGISFQWQENQGSGFVDITNGGIYSGATAAILDLTGVTAPMNGFLYRCVVGNGCDQSITSSNAALTIGGGLTINTQPSNQDGCVGDNETFTINAPSATTFQWQEDQGSGFSNITNSGIYSGVTSASLVLTNITTPLNGFLYRCLVSDGSCSATSNNTTLTVNEVPLITTNLALSTIQCEDNNFNLAILSNNASSFQWFEFNGVTWSALVDGGIYSGTNTATLAFNNPTGIDNFQYYCALTSPCGAVDSDTTLVRLIQITRQPIPQAGNAGDTVNLIVNSINETCGNGWEINTGSGWTLLVANAVVYPNGVSGDTLKVVVSSGLDAAWYRRVSCGSSCVKASDSAQVSIILFSNIRGNMYDFDGVDDYISVDTTPLGASNTQDISYTFEAWIYPDEVTTRQVIIGNHNYVGTTGTSLDIVSGQAQFFKQEGVDVVSGAITASEWHHVAGTYDTLTNEMRFYINGFLVGTTLSTQADAGGIHNIGTHSGDAGVPLSDFFNGKMDEVRIWKVARTQTEIRESMHRSLDGTEPDLALYYQFDRDKTTGTSLGVRDALGISHSTAQLAAASYLASEVHVGGGFSNTQSVTATGNIVFTGTNLEIDFPIAHPNGEVVATHVVTENPVNQPGNAPFETGYWVVNNFGTVNTALASTPFFRYADGSVGTNIVTEFTLYKRASRDFGAWTTFSPAATVDNTAGNNHCSFAGINDFSVLFPVNNTVLLDNQFLRFEAVATSEQAVLLSWEIEAEKDNQFFAIQHSVDGLNWKTIGQVRSINTPTLYSFLNQEPVNGQNYYRLKIIDLNNQSSYSVLKVVEFSQNMGYSVYPNPNPGLFNIDFQGLSGQRYSLEIYDAVGRKVYEQQLNSSKNTLNLRRQAAGMYTLKIQVGAQNYYTKIIISQ